MPISSEGHRPLLIEEWLPIRELGVESVRESAPIPGQFPKLKTIHVWWARRPLAACQGVQLAALLPAWSDSLRSDCPQLDQALQNMRSRRPDLRSDQATDATWYRAWVLWVAGVRGDAVGRRELILKAKETGRNLGPNPYGYRQAFKNSPTGEDLQVVHELLRLQWGGVPTVLDPTAGGGSIPFTSLRYGLPTIANDLNPVAVAILDATLRATSEFGPGLREELAQWGQVLTDRLQAALESAFEVEDPAENVSAYLWVNTVACPRTGGAVPLSPNWWLDSKGKNTKTLSQPRVAVKPEPVWEEGGPSHIDFRVLKETDFGDFDPDEGSIASGDAISPWDGLVVDGDWIKAEAQEGRIWPTLFAVACWKPKKKGRGKRRYFRSPDATDHRAVDRAAQMLHNVSDAWTVSNVLPTEELPSGNKTKEPLRYGIKSFREMFSDRQLLVHGTFVEQWRRIAKELEEQLGEEKGGQVAKLLALMAGKALDYNSRLCSWHTSRSMIRNTFDVKNFAFKWTFAEFDGGRSLWPWCLEQLLDSYEGIAELLELEPSGGLGSTDVAQRSGPLVSVLSGSASDLESIPSGSIECVNIDPPYYDNVMYAELADFFYVWEKRTVGTLIPEHFGTSLTDKDNEAVMNPARFADSGRRRRELASFDYQQKMQAIFAEAHRVLRHDGVLVVWFTHREADAWDTLGTAMIEAGFEIQTSWPVNTESDVSLNMARKNAAKSTVVLVARRRSQDSEGVFFEEIEADIRRAAVEAVDAFGTSVGATGVDLQLSTYGPTLSVISRYWPVLSDEAGEDGRARRVRPEEALVVAREEVNRLIKSRLVGYEAQFDDATDFWLLCWANFQAREFPYDEARKLGMSTLDVDDAVQAGLVKKKAGKVELVKPASRGRSLRAKMADNGRFPTLVDALHHLLNSYRDDGLASTRTWLADSGYGDERAFLDTLQASVNAIPRVRTKKGLSVLEAQELEDVVIALFGDKVELPAEVEELIEAHQTSLEV